MNTDEGLDLADGKNVDLLFKHETQEILGCAFDVLNEVGHGFHEKIYENGLTAAFRLKGIPFDQQRKFPVLFRGQQIGEFVPDLLVFNSIVVDPKVIERITDHEIGKMLNYLRITKCRVGLTLNFKYARLQWDRRVL
jgi:GxxExxY protein